MQRSQFRLIFEIFLITVIIGLLFRQGTLSPNHTGFYHENLIYWVPVREKVVELTYDDGPHPLYTPEILAILDHYHVVKCIRSLQLSKKRHYFV